MLADLAEANGDARGALVVGKEGLAEGHPLEAEAFPTFGLPSFNSIGYPVDKAVVYAIARQESQFNPRIVSSAKAMGYMQVTPEAGRHVAKLTGVAYDERRLMSDQTYNVQFGAAEIGELVESYRGNYVLAFAAYNAGRGNVAKWIQRYGDPRDPDVDVVDWVEAIPFSETRNYVQRVMENYQVYKVRFNIPSKLQMEADLRGGR
ncbi:lytic transglycosylase domain-containing protein [Xanthobacter autotrophicus]|nr:lytic transglycosylase domain-containing protein [Xanthobacter autotrophicus]